MKKGYKFDFATTTLTITNAFNKRAMEMNSTEYVTIGLFRADFPNLRIIVEAAPKRKNKRVRFTYEKIARYISCREDSNILLKMFTEKIEQSKLQKNPYLFIEKWFLTTFPDYDKIPSFDEHGNIIRADPLKENTSSLKTVESAPTLPPAA